MNCKEFEIWLSTRDIHESILPGEAVEHMAGCKTCQQLFNLDERLEHEIRKGFALEEVPKPLAARISTALDNEAPSRRNRFLLAAGGAAAALIIAVFLILPGKPEPPGFADLNQVSRQAVQDHLAGNRYMSFTAGEAGQALEILTRELGFQVLLPNIEALGCVLLGGRLCAFGKCRAAYFVLERKGRTGSLFIMDTNYLSFDMADGSRFNTRIKGCDASVWKDNGQVYAMVF